MEIVLLGVLAVLIFGPSRLPEIGRQIGRGVRDFKDSIDGTGIKDALEGVNEVRTAVSPKNMARAFVPGVADTQDAISGAAPAASESPAAAGDVPSGPKPAEAPSAP